MSGKIFEVQKKVYLADTDTTGIVYYGRHLEWMEMARVEFIAQIYKPLTRMIAEDKFSFMPINVNIDYKAPAVFEDVVSIKLWIREIEKIRLILGYQVTKMVEDKEVLVSEATITLLCISTEKGNRPSKIPDFLLQVFQDWEGK
jgi:acyl-CoA thioester hydrolase